jgi:hypothetical protein
LLAAFYLCNAIWPFDITAVTSAITRKQPLISSLHLTLEVVNEFVTTLLPLGSRDNKV